MKVFIEILKSICSNWKNALLIIGAVVIAILIFILKNKIETLEIYGNNLKAYQDSTIIYSKTKRELKNENDLLNKRIVNLADSLDVSLRELKDVIYVKQYITTTDTLFMNDTIFVESVALDTVIGDDFYNCELKFKYPNIVSITPSFANEVLMFHSEKRVTVKPPYKFFLFRWFQKKQKVQTIEIYNTNPYCINDTTRFVHILK